MNKKLPSLKASLKTAADFLLPYVDKLKEALPAEKPRLCVGMDIGSTSIKLIQLQKIGKGYKLTHYGIAQINNDNREEAVKSVLGTPAGLKKVNIAVSGQGVILRYVPM